MVSTWKSRPLSGFRLMRMAPASTPLRTSSAVAAASVRGSKSNFRTPGSPPGSGALSALSMTATARAASAASSATTPTCVTVARSRSRTPSGISATTTARPISSSVENTKARDRTRSMYSRRATSPTLVPFELSGMASGGAGGTACGLLVTPRPRPRRLATWRRGSLGALGRRLLAVDRGQVGLLVGRVADVVDEHLLEAGVRDLEVDDLGTGGDRRGEHGVRARARRRARPSSGPCPPGSIRVPGRSASHGRRWSSATEIRTIRRPVARRTSRIGPPTTTRPRSTIATDSHSASATSIWWVEKTTVRPRSRSSRNASRRSITLTGSRPVNGSSMSRTCGSCRTAAMNWIFCWLPFESCSARRSARSSARNRRSQSIATRRARSAGTPWRPAEELELLEDAHPRVQAALLGQVAPGRAREAVALDAAPGDPAGVGLEHAEGDPHRRRLARAVRAEESEHLALRDLEREVVEGHDAAEPLEQVIDDEGHGRARDVMRPRA